MTRARVEQLVRFDSVDSTTWSMGGKYGNLFVWKGDKFITLPANQKKDRKLYRKFFKAQDIDMSKILADDGDEVRKCNIIAWRLLSERWQEKAKRRELAALGVGEPKYPDEPEDRDDE
jgi:hypothetical protein